MGALMIVKGCFIVFFCHRKEVAQQTGNEIKMCLSSADTRGSTVKSKGHLMTTGAPQKGGGCTAPSETSKQHFTSSSTPQRQKSSTFVYFRALSAPCFVMCVITRLYFARDVSSFFYPGSTYCVCLCTMLLCVVTQSDTKNQKQTSGLSVELQTFRNVHPGLNNSAL